MSMVFGRKKAKDRAEKGHPYVEVGDFSFGKY